MSKPKRSITRDSVFKSTQKAHTPKQGISKQEVRTYQTAVWLTDEETNWIDTRLQQIKNLVGEELPVQHLLESSYTQRCNSN